MTLNFEEERSGACSRYFNFSDALLTWKSRLETILNTSNRRYLAWAHHGSLAALFCTHAVSYACGDISCPLFAPSDPRRACDVLALISPIYSPRPAPARYRPGYAPPAGPSAPVPPPPPVPFPRDPLGRAGRHLLLSRWRSANSSAGGPLPLPVPTSLVW